MSQLLERLLPGFLQILAMLLLVGGFYLPLLLFLGGQDPLQPGVSVLRLNYLLEFLADPWNLRVLGFSLEQAFWSAVLSILLEEVGGKVLWRTHVHGCVVGEQNINEALGIWYPTHQAFLDLMTAPSSKKNMELRSLAVEHADLHRCNDYTA